MTQIHTVNNSPNRLKFERRTQYVYCRLPRKDQDYFALRRTLQDIAEESFRFECPLILVEDNILNEMELGDILQLVRDLPMIGFARSRLAIVNRRINHRETNEFANTVAKNRSIPMRAFDSVGAAETWLLAS